MDREGGSNGGSCYYAVLGIRKDASFSDVRTAYRKLALVFTKNTSLLKLRFDDRRLILISLFLKIPQLFLLVLCFVKQDGIFLAV